MPERESRDLFSDQIADLDDRVTRVEKLVKEWREAQLAIDRMTLQQRRSDRRPLDRVIAAHNALVKYADEEIK